MSLILRLPSPSFPFPAQLVPRPPIVGVITDTTGDIRYVFFFLGRNDLECDDVVDECGCGEGKDNLTNSRQEYSLIL